MNQLFQIFFKLILISLGIIFFFIMLFIAALVMLVFGLRMLWYKITGKKPQSMASFRINPLDGFGYFYSRTQEREDAPRPSQRPLEDVTDVSIKEIKKPSERE